MAWEIRGESFLMESSICIRRCAPTCSNRDLSSVSNVLQYQYAARIVLAATVAASKISLALLIMSLMGEARSLLASRSLLGIIIAWSIAAIFTIAFECAPPNPWDTARGCIDQVLVSALLRTDSMLTIRCVAGCILWHLVYRYYH